MAKHECPVMVVPRGYWLPTAAILCAECAREARQGGVDWKTDVDFDATPCMRCGQWIAVRTEVADLNNLRVKFGAGEMAQTGGMCCALEFEDLDAGGKPLSPIVIVTAHGPGEGYYIGRYNPLEVDPDEMRYDYDEPEMLAEDASLEHAIETLREALQSVEDLEAQARTLADGFACAISFDEQGPIPFAVWSLGGAAGDDIIGTGKTKRAALEAAIATMKGWE